MPQMNAAATLIMLDGKEFWASPLDDRDITELENWLRSRTLRNAREAAVGLTEPERREILSVATETIANMTFGEGTMKLFTSTLEGVSRVTWVSLRKRHPTIRHEDVRAMLFKDAAAQQEAVSAFQELNLRRENDEAARGGGVDQPTPADEGRDLLPAGETIQVHAGADRDDDTLSADGVA